MVKGPLPQRGVGRSIPPGRVAVVPSAAAGLQRDKANIQQKAQT